MHAVDGACVAGVEVAEVDHVEHHAEERVRRLEGRVETVHTARARVELEVHEEGVDAWEEDDGEEEEEVGHVEDHAMDGNHSGAHRREQLHEE